ncbi:MAG TPA: hypothetical protein VI542_06030 [Candidatus Tectomicrobia bacterium]
MPPFPLQPPPRRPARSRCLYCGQEAAWLCENYCTEPRAYGEAPVQPPAPCSCGSTVWQCAYCGTPRPSTPPSEAPAPREDVRPPAYMIPALPLRARGGNKG